MITRGTILEIINEKFAILQFEIKQAGTIGLNNLAKHAEPLMQGLLEIVYQIPLVNLNSERPNYPGIDLASEPAGIAYQITSENSSNKINDTLRAFIENQDHYRFNRMIVFMLTPLKRSYSVKPLTDHDFKFDSAKDIMDFGSLLKIIANLPNERVDQIRNLLDKELPYALASLKLQDLPSLTDQLINVKKGLVENTMQIYAHWQVKITLPGDTLTAPRIYKDMDGLLFNSDKKRYLPVFYTRWEKESGLKKIRFEKPPADAEIARQLSEYALTIHANQVVYEYALYSDRDRLHTHLNYEVEGLLTLVIALNLLYPQRTIELQINLNASGILCFNWIGSIYQLSKESYFHQLNGPFKYTKTLNKAEDEDVMDMMEEILHAFVCKPNNYGQPNLTFLTIDKTEQAIRLERFRKRISYPKPNLNNIGS